MRKNGLFHGVIAFLGLFAVSVHPGRAEGPALPRIGVAAGVRGTVEVFAPQRKEAGRIVQSGRALYLNDVVQTGAGGRLQILLNDETVFTLGPNASLTLDEFVYDPGTGFGKLTVRITKGAFRFVTGLIGHHRPSDMNVEFPVGSLGIRGTIVAGQVDEGRALAVLLGPGPGNAAGERPGAFVLENAGVSVLVAKPGYASHIDGPGIPPSRPAPLPPGQFDALLNAVTSLPTQESQGQDTALSAPSVSGVLAALTAPLGQIPAIPQYPGGTPAASPVASGIAAAGLAPLSTLANTAPVTAPISVPALSPAITLPAVSATVSLPAVSASLTLPAVSASISLPAISAPNTAPSAPSASLPTLPTKP